MKPNPGLWRLEVTYPQSHAGLHSLVRITNTQIRSHWGVGTWDDVQDWFFAAKIDTVIRCTGEGTFVAIVRHGEEDEEEYGGTCEPEEEE